MRNAAAVALLLLPLLAPDEAAGAATKPPRGAKAPASGRAPRLEPVLRLGGAQLDLQALRDQALHELKERMAAAVQAGAEEIRTAFDAETNAVAQQVYDDFLFWLNERVRARLLRQYPHLKSEAAIEEKYAEWLESPDQELSHYVDLYLQERAPAIRWLLDAYRDEASWEIAGGVKDLFEDAQGKLQRFTQVVSDAEREPNTPTADLLRKHGLGGDWIDRFEAYEDRFRTFDEGYKVVEATEILVGAFQTKVPREKIRHLTELMTLMGGVAEDSQVPIASLFGQIVKAYGDVAREMLGQIDRLSKQLRERAGYCVGAGATGDDRQRAFVRQFGSREQACPTRLKDVYERTLPADGRIYFFVDGRFRAGREGNGEFPAVLKARALVHAAVAQGDATWQGRENDLGVLADVYDVAYTSPQHGTGVGGLLREAEETMAGIARRQAELERGLASPCGEAALRRALERATGLRSGDGFEPVAGNEQRLAVRYAVGYIRGGGAHVTYSRIWSALRELSLLQVSGRVVGQGGGPCAACSRAALQVAPTGLEPIPGCEATHADADGRFALHLLGRSADFRLALSASQAGQRSPVVEVTRAVVGIERVPFVRAFSGVRLELPGAPVAAVEAPVSPTPRSPVGPVGPGVHTNVGEGAASPPSGGSAAPPEPRPPDTPRAAPQRRSVPDLAGLTADAAGQRLGAAGLVAAIVGGDPAPRAALAFTVQDQEPVAGTLVPPGARVTVRLHSACDTRRTVPTVVGLPAAEAEARLRGAGFQVELTGGDPPSSAAEAFRVQDQRPAAGEAAAVGSRVTVRVHSRFEPGRGVPSVIGLTAGEAEARLRAAGFVPEIAGGDPAPTREAAFTVQSQEPTPQTPLEAGAPVSVRVHSAFVERAAPPSPAPPTPPAPAGAPSRFRCPAFGSKAAVDAGTPTVCWYSHDGGLLLLWPWWEDGSRPSSGQVGCGRATEVDFKPFDRSSLCGRSGQPPCTFWGDGPRLRAVFHSASRRANVRVDWERRAAQPLPREIEDLARRALAQAEPHGLACSPAAPPVTSAPTPRPAATAAPAPSTGDDRPSCTCTDPAGRRYRMTLGQECDPSSYLRDDNCRP